MPILVKMRGGLSNQMFQYAAARRLAHVHGTQVRIDSRWYQNIPTGATPRRYELANFNITGVDASSYETIGMDGVRNSAWQDLPIALWRKVIPRYRFVQEQYFHFDERILRLPDRVCLFGYWVSERYFKDIEAIIRKEFTVKHPADSRSLALREEMVSRDSVSLHVRRGDYVMDPTVNRLHGICSLEYYASAVAYITDRVRTPHFYVFSDDAEWVRAHLPVPHPVTYITHNSGPKSYEDIRLMSSCHHNIIANSGFSWWGAWLNASPEKIVIAPKRWFNEAPHDTRDVIPQGWVQL